MEEFSHRDNSTMSTSTPSPEVSATMGPTASRRPPRKSTLTQQQKNQKRQRATQEQLITLEVEFNKNPTPTATVRERIADDIQMTERSVQIWFQNRSVNARQHLMATADPCIDARRSSCLPRRASRLAKTAMRSLTLCAHISRIRHLNLVNH